MLVANETLSPIVRELLSKPSNHIILENLKLTLADVTAIINSESVANVEEVKVNKCNLSDSEISILACNKTWKNLKDLSLNGNRIKDQGAEAIGNNTTWSNLES